MRIAVVGMAGAGNLGDDIIALMLADLLRTRYPSALIGIFSHGEKIPRSFGAGRIYVEEDKLIFLRRPRISFGLVEASKDRKAIRKFVSEADLVCIGGGGILQDSHFRYTIHRYLRFGFFSKYGRAIIVGAGIGPIKRPSNRRYLKEMHSRFSSVQVRDEYSLDLFREITGKTTDLSSDIVLGAALESVGIEKRSENSVLGCSLRPWQGLDVAKVADYIGSICQNENLSCSLFVFEFTKKNRSELELAFEVKDILEGRRIRTKILTYNLDPVSVFFEELTAVKKAIAMRYHANIIWQKLGVPTVPISYAPKVSSLYQENGIVKIPTVDNLNCLDNFPFIRLDLHATYELPSFEGVSFELATFRQKAILHFVDILDHLVILLKYLIK